MENKSRPPSKKRPYSNYIKYSSIGFQMVATILLGLLIGNFLDKRFESENSIFTLIFSLIFVMAAIFLGIRGVLKK